MARYKVYEKGFKAYEKGLKCKGKQYKENTIFTEDKASICNYGMHFCKEPLDVLNHYPLVDDNGNMTEFTNVEALAECEHEGDKSCTTKLKIGTKISFTDLFKLQFDIDFWKEINDSKLSDDGYYAQIGSSGDFAKIGSSGYSAQIGSSGDSAIINSSGQDSVIMCAGNNSRAKAKKGSWITLAEWEFDENKKRYVPKYVKTEFVDGEKIKEDTLYCLCDGEFKEVEERN